jgi:uncharacterized membrane protein YfcA
VLNELVNIVSGRMDVLAASAVVIGLAAIVRGFSGFGFSLLSITAMSLFMPVSQVIPSIFLLEIAASINLVPGIWRDIQWKSIAWLLGGYVIGVPIGIKALVNLPADPMQIALGVFVISVATLMLRGFQLRRTPGRLLVVTTGAVSGLLNGAFGTGGPPVVLLYFSTPAGAAQGRASVIFFWLATDVIGIALLAREGLVTMQSFAQSILWLPALIGGIWIGARAFHVMDPVAFRRWVLVILMALAFLGIAKATINLA